MNSSLSPLLFEVPILFELRKGRGTVDVQDVAEDPRLLDLAVYGPFPLLSYHERPTIIEGGRKTVY